MRRFWSSRRSFAARPGRVGRRRFGRRQPRRELLGEALQRQLAVPGLAAGVLGDGADALAQPLGEQAPVGLAERLEAPTSKTASIREAVTFACWPPGPEERLARSSISASGIATRSFTRSSSVITPR